jgi:AraC-like DNA-binding protein
MAKVPTSRFDYREFPPADRLPAFRQMTASLYETWAQGDPESFRADALGHQVRDLVFSEVEFSPARFKRSAMHLQGDGKDFLTLHAQLSGIERLTMDHGFVQLLPGRIYLRDWAYPYECLGTPMYMHTIVIPRHRLPASVMLGSDNPILDWQIAEPEGGMLFKLWAELVQSFATVTLQRAELLCEAFLGFVDGLLGGQARNDTPATLHTMERFLATNLRRGVGVEELCERFHVSRASVYRLFEPHGGVRAYLNRVRLERAHADLRQADPKYLQIADIAASWQFDDPSTFSRKFRAQFGQCPSEVLGIDFQTQEVPYPENIHGADMYAVYRKWFHDASNPVPPSG